MTDFSKLLGEWTGLELAELFDERLRIMLGEKQNSNLGATLRQVADFRSELQEINTKLDKRIAWEGKVTTWKQEEAMPSFELLRNQIAELRREVDKLRGAGLVKPE